MLVANQLMNFLLPHSTASGIVLLMSSEVFVNSLVSKLSYLRCILYLYGQKEILIFFNDLKNSRIYLFMLPFFFYVLGIRIVFWDLRESFLYRLYRGSVEDARLDSLLPHLDSVRYFNFCHFIF